MTPAIERQKLSELSKKTPEFQIADVLNANRDLIFKCSLAGHTAISILQTFRQAGYDWSDSGFYKAYSKLGFTSSEKTTPAPIKDNSAVSYLEKANKSASPQQIPRTNSTFNALSALTRKSLKDRAKEVL